MNPPPVWMRAPNMRYSSALRNSPRTRQSLLISHRFSTVRMANRIVVLEGGRVAEQGSHEKLLSQGGRYAAMFELQASSYR